MGWLVAHFPREKHAAKFRYFVHVANARFRQGMKFGPEIYDIQEKTLSPDLFPKVWRRLGQGCQSNKVVSLDPAQWLTVVLPDLAQEETWDELLTSLISVIFTNWRRFQTFEAINFDCFACPCPLEKRLWLCVCVKSYPSSSPPFVWSVLRNVKGMTRLSGA